jgi:hypothetical protein
VIIVRRAGINDAPAYQSITYDNADRVATIALTGPISVTVAEILGCCEGSACNALDLGHSS